MASPTTGPASRISAGCSARRSALSGSARSARSPPAWRAAFGMRVLYCNRNRLPAAQEAKLGVEYAELDRLLAQSDFVSLHATNIPSNKGLIDAKTFAAMKPTAFFVNTARGPIVDEDALYDALTKGTIAGAGLDVHASSRARRRTSSRRCRT